MAGGDIVILNPQATNEAITQFEAVKKELGALEGNLQSNAEKLKGAWKGQASDEYYMKNKKFIENVNAAQMLLEKRITDIDTRTSREKAADDAAKRAADSVNSFEMK